MIALPGITLFVSIVVWHATWQWYGNLSHAGYHIVESPRSLENQFVYTALIDGMGILVISSEQATNHLPLPLIMAIKEIPTDVVAVFLECLTGTVIHIKNHTFLIAVAEDVLQQLFLAHLA